MTEGWQCCFCGHGIAADDDLAVKGTLTNLLKGTDPEWPLQEVYSHAQCLTDRLRPDFPFDAEALADRPE